VLRQRWRVCDPVAMVVANHRSDFCRLSRARC